MKNVIKNRNFWLMISSDIILIASAYVFSHLLRFGGSIPAEYLASLKKTLFWVIAIKVFFFFKFDLYRGMWRYTGLVDLVNLIKACLSSSIILVLWILFLFRFQGFSRSAYIIDFFLSVIFLSVSRLGVRIFLSDAPPSFWTFLPYKKMDAKKILIIGAGDTGEKVLREIINSPRINMIPVGFLDDDQSKHGKSIHGVPVLGDISQLSKIAVFFEEVLIAVPSASGSQMRQIVENCEKAGKRYKTMPPLAEIINGKVSLKMVREVTISDLLGREEVRLDDEEIKKYLFNKRILVTGAGGSIGSELVRQICRFNPRSIAMLDFSEFNLYQVEMDCRINFRYIKMVSYLADIRNVSTTERIFHEYSPEVVFHAAAYKHVPMQEMSPWEAVCNNLIGTKNIIKNAIDIKADHFIMVSSDKAVRPVNIMGATKRVCELMTSGGNGNVKTKFMSVRFGNVIGSSGSVVPLFQKQIASGGPVTVTHPEIKRYFMSIPEAAQLILQAGAMGEGGEIYVLEMGDPIRIADLAHEIIKLNGLEPGKDIEIVFIGLRPGEKLYEELITEGEGIVPTHHEKIMVLKGDATDYERLTTQVDELIEIAGSFDAAAIKKKLQEIVPEYSPQ